MDPAELRESMDGALGPLVAYAAASSAGEGPAVTRRPRPEVAGDLGVRRLLREGGLDASTFPAWLERYLRDGVRVHHPGEMAHQVAAPDVPAALADLVHGVANQPMSLYEMGAAAAAIEHEVVGWMLEKAGLDPGSGGGVLTHGGSLANLTALLAARAAAAPEAWTGGTPPGLAILAPPSAHYSIARAAGILGIGEDAIVALETDGLGRIRPERIAVAVARLRAAGRRPMALVAAACATSTGLHDDLRAVAAACRRDGVWLHVDAAHGASALLHPVRRLLLEGIEHADSLVWDAHKMLRTSAVCAAVLVRDARRLTGAFRQQASYLDLSNAQGVDTLDRQVECTKAELGLKVFLNLAWRGEEALGAYVDGRYAETRRLWEMLRERPGFEAPYEPESNILCFRHGGDAASQDGIREALLAEGRFHIGATDLGGRRHLRVVVTSPDTGEETFAALLEAIEGAAVRGEGP